MVNDVENVCDIASIDDFNITSYCNNPLPEIPAPPEFVGAVHDVTIVPESTEKLGV